MERTAKNIISHCENDGFMPIFNPKKPKNVINPLGFVISMANIFVNKSHKLNS